MMWRSMFSSTVLSKGRRLYNDGDIKRIQKKSEASYEVRVYDINTYTVNIEFLGKDEIKLKCNCQYGAFCQHAAAALYDIDDVYKISDIIAWVEAKKNNQSPFGNPEDYQYFNLKKITRNERFSREANEKAAKLAQNGDVVLTSVECWYEIYNGSLCADLTGYYCVKGSNIQNRILVRMDSDKILYKTCEAKGCGYGYYDFDNRIPATSMCVHQVGLLMLFEEYQKTHSVGDNTDLGAAKFISRYRKKRVNFQPEGEITASKFQLEPKLEKSREGLRLKFRIGTDKLYAVKNITNLVYDVECGNTMKLGTKNELNFGVCSADEGTKGVLEFAKGIVHDVERVEERRRIPSYIAPYAIRDSIELFGNRIDDFFELYKGRAVPFEDKETGVKNTSITLQEGAPKCRLTIHKNIGSGKFEGITVSGDFPTCLEGNRAGYYIAEEGTRGNYLNRFSNEQMELLGPLSDIAHNGKISFNVGINHLAEFFYKVLPELSQVVEVEQPDSEVIEQYLPPEARFMFYLDAENGNVTCSVEAMYGDVAFSLKDMLQKDNRAKYRDYEQEGIVLREVGQIRSERAHV